jgi:ribonuclease BN (tRNA processing enzyme)
MKLRTLGISGSAAGVNSPASTYLLHTPAEDVAACIESGTLPDSIEIRDWNAVLDLGNGGLAPLLRYVKPIDLDAVYLSHLHPDHCADLSGLYVHLKYHPIYGSATTGKLKHLPILGPSSVAERVEEACGIADGASMRGPFDFQPGVSARHRSVGPMFGHALRGRHTVESYVLRVSGPSSLPEKRGQFASMAYSGDTDSCPELVEVARDVDLFLCEAAFVEGRDDALRGIHLTGKRAGQAAQEAGARKLLLTHIPDWNDPQVTLAEARTEYSGVVELAQPDGCYVL